MPASIVATIEKLLAKANDPAATPAEAETYTIKAHELIEKYQVADQLNANANPTAREGVVIRRIFANVKGQRLVKAKRELIITLADLHSCKLIAHGKNGRNAMSLVGHETDVDLVMMVFTSMMIQMDTALHIARRNGEVIGASGPVSYAHGWVRRVGHRLVIAKAERANAETDGGMSTALVLVDRTALVQAKVAETWPKLYAGRASHKSINDYSAYGAGDRDGRKADIGGTRLTGGAHSRELS